MHLWDNLPDISALKLSNYNRTDLVLSTQPRNQLLNKVHPSQALRHNMGVQGFQEYLEKRCPGAAVPVDLLKLARTAGRQPPHHYHYHHHHHHPHHPSSLPPPPPPARILVDADSGLQRLYGGYQTDWVCGGEWNAMLGYLAALSQACLYQGGLELVVVFNGTLGKDRWPEWARRAQGQRQTAQLIVNHVGSKATPPPRAWFLPPACLSHCVRLAMFRFRVRVSGLMPSSRGNVDCHVLLAAFLLFLHFNVECFSQFVLQMHCQFHCKSVGKASKIIFKIIHFH